MHEGTGVLGWLSATAIAQAMRGSVWLFPIVEIIHIIGFVMLVGTAVIFDLRLLGVSKNLSVQALGQLLLGWSAGSLLLIVPAGLMMFSTHPQDFAVNRVFQLKLALIFAAGLNALLFHMGIYRSVHRWDAGVDAPLAAKAHAVISIGLWISVICCGRLLAYTG